MIYRVAVQYQNTSFSFLDYYLSLCRVKCGCPSFFIYVIHRAAPHNNVAAATELYSIKGAARSKVHQAY
jgi:hypothetical protein